MARPLTVGLLLPWFRFSVREILFVSWVGLKGAVPIVLATYPFLFGAADASLLFNVVFFVEGDLVEYTVSADSLAAGRHVRDLRLPDGVVIAVIVRHREIIPPRGSTHLHPAITASW